MRPGIARNAACSAASWLTTAGLAGGCNLIPMLAREMELTELSMGGPKRTSFVNH